MEHTQKWSTHRNGALDENLEIRCSAIVAIVAAGIMLTDGVRARDLRTTGPMPGPSVSVLNSATTTMTQPVVPKTTAAPPTSAASKLAAPTIEVRDHGPGGNADPCLTYHHCDQGSELKSLIAYYQNAVPTASFCAKGFPAGTCYQGFVYPDGTGHTKIFYIGFASLGGRPLPGQMDKFFNVMKQAEANYKGPTYKSSQVVEEPANRANGHPRDHRN
jgi:hypothetical protein